MEMFQFFFGRGGAWETTPQCEDHLLDWSILLFGLSPYMVSRFVSLFVFLALSLETVHVVVHLLFVSIVVMSRVRKPIAQPGAAVVPFLG